MSPTSRRRPYTICQCRDGYAAPLCHHLGVVKCYSVAHFRGRAPRPSLIEENDPIHVGVEEFGAGNANLTSRSAMGKDNCILILSAATVPWRSKWEYLSVKAFGRLTRKSIWRPILGDQIGRELVTLFNSITNPSKECASREAHCVPIG